MFDKVNTIAKVLKMHKISINSIPDFIGLPEKHRKALRDCVSYWLTNMNVGSRLCFHSEKAAKFCVSIPEFFKLYEDYFLYTA